MLADGGTLFLDEIGELSLKTQAKLVKVIEAQRFEPLGSADSVSSDARIIAATSKNLRELIARGRFREDLFFKINVISLVIPPLRERAEDIPLLINYFLKYFCLEYGKKLKTMSPEALTAFSNYSWPGNVSELMNVIERFVILVPDEKITAAHLSLLVEARELEAISGLTNGQSLEKARELFEKKFIHRNLMKNCWDVTRTAAALELTPQALKAKIEAMNITFME
jgi:two-component system nitrogen regulation response regulator NtrX